MCSRLSARQRNSVAGAMGVALAAEQTVGAAADFQRSVRLDAALLAAVRPTAVNLAVGVQRALAAVGDAWENPTLARLRLTAAAEQFHAAEVWCCSQIGAHGAGLFGAGARICAICNAGALATASRTSRRWVWCGDCRRMVWSRLSGCRRRDHCCRVRV